MGYERGEQAGVEQDRSAYQLADFLKEEQLIVKGTIEIVWDTCGVLPQEDQWEGDIGKRGNLQKGYWVEKKIGRGDAAWDGEVAGPAAVIP